MKEIYTLLIVEQEISVFRKHRNGWEIVPIDGEDRNPAQTLEDVVKSVDKINRHINLEKQLADVELIVVCDDDLQSTLPAKLPEHLNRYQCSTFRFVPWQESKQDALQLRPAKGKAPQHNTDWLKGIFLPLLVAEKSTPGQAILEQNKINKEHQENIAKLQAERDRLEKEIALLKEQMRSLSMPDLEQLTTYLPIIYRNFWNSIKPSDLALIAGSYRIPEVPSPFPEPGRDTIALMKKRLQNLPQSEYDKIINICRELPHQLEIRPEMRFILEEGD